MMTLNVLGAILITSEIILKSETPAKNLNVAINRRLGDIGSRITVVWECKIEYLPTQQFGQKSQNIPGEQ